jgi:hypothetical protein
VKVGTGVKTRWLSNEVLIWEADDESFRVRMCVIPPPAAARGLSAAFVDTVGLQIGDQSEYGCRGPQIRLTPDLDKLHLEAWVPVLGSEHSRLLWVDLERQEEEVLKDEPGDWIDGDDDRRECCVSQ